MPNIVGKPTQPFSDAEVQTSRDDSQDIWTLSNDVLYKLCQDYPENSDLRKVVTKVMIIGKTHSAAIERRRTWARSKIKVEDYYKKVAAEITTLDLDAELCGMQSTEPSELKDLRPTLDMHQKIVGAVEKFSKNRHRSFASKYLHFHAPNWFFIFDSIATGVLNKQVPRRQYDVALSSIGDDNYRNFVQRAWGLCEQLGHPRLTPRELDRLLYKRGLATQE
jgi:hypothetical protein